MPHIHHVAIWASDLDVVCAFYRDAFGARIGPLYENRAKGFSSRFLSFEAGPGIEVMSSSAVTGRPGEPGPPAPGLTHLAVSVGSEAEVDRRTAALRARGARVASEPRRTGDGYYESVVLDPEGNRVEVTA